MHGSQKGSKPAPGVVGTDTPDDICSLQSPPPWYHLDGAGNEGSAYLFNYAPPRRSGRTCASLVHLPPGAGSPKSTGFQKLLFLYAFIGPLGLQPSPEKVVGVGLGGLTTF